MLPRTCYIAPGFRAEKRSSRRVRRGRVLGALILAHLLVHLPVRAQALELSPGATTLRPSLPAAPGERLLILVASLTGEGTPADRKQAALDILKLGTDDSVTALSGILALKNNVAAKQAICDALAEVDTIPEGLADSLLGLLQQQKEQALRDGAVAALYRFSDVTVSRRLRDFLEQEELQWLRTENVARSRELYSLLPRESDRVARLQMWLKAAQPLDRLTALEIVHSAMLATTPTPPAKEVLQQIRQMLRDPDESVRRKLVVVLRDLQEKDDATRIAGMLEHERSPVVLEEVYKALGRMGAVESIPACITGLQSASNRVAAGAADALGRLCRKTGVNAPLQTSAAVEALLKKSAIAIDDATLRAQIVSAMAAIADPKFQPVLVSYADAAEPVPQIRQAALTGLGEIGDPASVDLVVARLAEDKDPGVREAAAEALGKLGSKPVHLRPLYLRLNEPSQAVQNGAWRAYRQLFARLAWAERLEVLATWAVTDKASNARRIDLLNDLEAQATTAKSGPGELVRIREELGDSLLAATEYSLAAAAFSRAMESMTSEQAGRRLAIAPKLLDAYLHVPAHDKAITVAAGAQSPPMVAAMADRLLTYLQDLAKIDGRAASECLERFKTGAPAMFSAEYSSKFEQVRRSATQPSTTAPGK